MLRWFPNVSIPKNSRNSLNRFIILILRLQKTTDSNLHIRYQIMMRLVVDILVAIAVYVADKDND